jgi:proline racemase/trans-L-3-hydroxyproline dehydratase
MCGHGVIAVATLAFEQGLIVPRTPGELVLDAPAGQVHATAQVDRTSGRTRVTGVSFRNVPSFVLAAGIPVRLGTRTVPADVAFGGAFYAIVDSEAAGIPIRPERLDDLRRAGMEIKHAVESVLTVAHPEEPLLNGLYGTIFTGPPEAPDADLRNVTVFAEGEVDRSPCGTGTCAVMAVLAAMGLLAPEQTFTHESIIGTRFRGRIERELAIAGIPAIVPRLAGEAFMTGSHAFVIHPDDPLGRGFRL